MTSKIAANPDIRDSDVARFEVIDGDGRAYTVYGASIELSYQDDGRTLKAFVRDRNDAASAPEKGATDSLDRDPDVTRFEVIDGSGRAYTVHDAAIDLSYQDGGATLKVFVHPRNDEVLPSPD